MKKYLFSACLFLSCAIAFIGLSSHSTTFSGPSGASFPMRTTLDTLANATNDSMVWACRWGGKAGVTLQFNFKKISGTAGGTILIYGSADNGASYKTTPITTLNITTASSQQLGYTITGNPYTHIMAVVIDTGTQSSSVQGWVYPQ